MFTFDGITIRTVERFDLEKMRALRNDFSTWINLTDIQLINVVAQERWFSTISESRDRKYFVVCDKEHDFIGIVRCDEIDHLNRSMRIGCDVVPELRGKGYGSRIYDLLLKYCFDFLNMHRLWLLVIDTNLVAMRLYARKGFREEGRYRDALFRDGRYRDYIIMSILEHEYRQQTIPIQEDK